MKHPPIKEGATAVRNLLGDPEERPPNPEKFGVTPFACKLLPEQGFGFRTADAAGCRVFASHFPSNEAQDGTKGRAFSIPSRSKSFFNGICHFAHKGILFLFLSFSFLLFSFFLALFGNL
jgi:hypothetical protein